MVLSLDHTSIEGHSIGKGVKVKAITKEEAYEDKGEREDPFVVNGKLSAEKSTSYAAEGIRPF